MAVETPSPPKQANNVTTRDRRSSSRRKSYIGILWPCSTWVKHGIQYPINPPMTGCCHESSVFLVDNSAAPLCDDLRCIKPRTNLCDSRSVEQCSKAKVSCHVFQLLVVGVERISHMSSHASPRVYMGILYTADIIVYTLWLFNIAI